MNTKKINISASFFLALIPAAFTALAVMRSMVYFPFADDWALVPLLSAIHSGTAGFSDYWRQHNEHRILTAQLIHAGLAMATKWDLRYPVAVNFAAASAAGVCLYLLIRRERDTLGKENFLWLPAAASVFVFSFRQYENWVWPSELVCFLASLGAVSCTLLLSRSEFQWKFLSAAVLSGTLASFSFTSGLMVWPMGVFVLCFSAGARRRKALALWSLAGLAVLALWMNGYEKPVHHPALSTDAGSLCAYFFRYLGASFSPRGDAAFLFGSAGFALYSFVVVKLLFSRLVPGRVTVALAAPGLFSLINGAVIAVGRAGFGAQQAMAPRYVTFSYLFWVSLILLLVLAARSLRLRGNAEFSGGKRPAFLCMALAAALTAGAAGASFQSFPEMTRHQKRVNIAALQLLDTPASANLQPVYPSPKDIKVFIALLQEWRFNIFDPSQERRLRAWAASRS